MKIYAVPGETIQYISKTREGAVEMEGLRPSQLHIAQADGTWALDADKVQEQQRLEEIKQAQESAGLRKISVSQAEQVIDNRLDPVAAMPVQGASDTETVTNIEAKINAIIEANRWLYKKIAVYLLNGK